MATGKIYNFKIGAEKKYIITGLSPPKDAEIFAVKIADADVDKAFRPYVRVQANEQKDFTTTYSLVGNFKEVDDASLDGLANTRSTHSIQFQVQYKIIRRSAKGSEMPDNWKYTYEPAQIKIEDMRSSPIERVMYKGKSKGPAGFMVEFKTPHGMQVGDDFVVSGSSDALADGTYPIIWLGHSGIAEDSEDPGDVSWREIAMVISDTSTDGTNLRNVAAGPHKIQSHTSPDEIIKQSKVELRVGQKDEDFDTTIAIQEQLIKIIDDSKWMYKANGQGNTRGVDRGYNAMNIGLYGIDIFDFGMWTFVAILTKRGVQLTYKTAAHTLAGNLHRVIGRKILTSADKIAKAAKNMVKGQKRLWQLKYKAALLAKAAGKIKERSAAVWLDPQPAKPPLKGKTWYLRSGRLGKDVTHKKKATSGWLFKIEGVPKVMEDRAVRRKLRTMISAEDMATLRRTGKLTYKNKKGNEITRTIDEIFEDGLYGEGIELGLYDLIREVLLDPSAAAKLSMKGVADEAGPGAAAGVLMKRFEEIGKLLDGQGKNVDNSRILDVNGKFFDLTYSGDKFPMIVMTSRQLAKGDPAIDQASVNALVNQFKKFFEESDCLLMDTFNTKDLAKANAQLLRGTATKAGTKRVKLKLKVGVQITKAEIKAAEKELKHPYKYFLARMAMRTVLHSDNMKHGAEKSFDGILAAKKQLDHLHQVLANVKAVTELSEETLTKYPLVTNLSKTALKKLKKTVRERLAVVDDLISEGQSASVILINEGGEMTEAGIKAAIREAETTGLPFMLLTHSVDSAGVQRTFVVGVRGNLDQVFKNAENAKSGSSSLVDDVFKTTKNADGQPAAANGVLPRNSIDPDTFLERMGKQAGEGYDDPNITFLELTKSKGDDLHKLASTSDNAIHQGSVKRKFGGGWGGWGTSTDNLSKGRTLLDEAVGRLFAGTTANRASTAASLRQILPAMRIIWRMTVDAAVMNADNVAHAIRQLSVDSISAHIHRAWAFNFYKRIKAYRYIYDSNGVLVNVLEETMVPTSRTFDKRVAGEIGKRNDDIIRMLSNPTLRKKYLTDNPGAEILLNHAQLPNSVLCDGEFRAAVKQISDYWQLSPQARKSLIDPVTKKPLDINSLVDEVGERVNVLFKELPDKAPEKALAVEAIAGLKAQLKNMEDFYPNAGGPNAGRASEKLDVNLLKHGIYEREGARDGGDAITVVVKNSTHGHGSTANSVKIGNLIVGPRQAADGKSNIQAGKWRIVDEKIIKIDIAKKLSEKTIRRDKSKTLQKIQQNSRALRATFHAAIIAENIFDEKRTMSKMLNDDEILNGRDVYDNEIAYTHDGTVEGRIIPKDGELKEGAVPNAGGDYELTDYFYGFGVRHPDDPTHTLPLLTHELNQIHFERLLAQEGKMLGGKRMTKDGTFAELNRQLTQSSQTMKGVTYEVQTRAIYTYNGIEYEVVEVLVKDLEKGTSHPLVYLRPRTIVAKPALLQRMKATGHHTQITAQQADEVGADLLKRGDGDLWHNHDKANRKQLEDADLSIVAESQSSVQNDLVVGTDGKTNDFFKNRRSTTEIRDTGLAQLRESAKTNRNTGFYSGIHGLRDSGTETDEIFNPHFRLVGPNERQRVFKVGDDFGGMKHPYDYAFPDTPAGGALQTEIRTDKGLLRRNPGAGNGVNHVGDARGNRFAPEESYDNLKWEHGDTYIKKTQLDNGQYIWADPVVLTPQENLAYRGHGGVDPKTGEQFDDHIEVLKELQAQGDHRYTGKNYVDFDDPKVIKENYQPQWKDHELVGKPKGDEADYATKPEGMYYSFGNDWVDYSVKFSDMGDDFQFTFVDFTKYTVFDETLGRNRPFNIIEINGIDDLKAFSGVGPNVSKYWTGSGQPPWVFIDEKGRRRINWDICNEHGYDGVEIRPHMRPDDAFKIHRTEDEIIDDVFTGRTKLIPYEGDELVQIEQLRNDVHWYYRAGFDVESGTIWNKPNICDEAGCDSLTEISRDPGLRYRNDYVPHDTNVQNSLQQGAEYKVSQRALSWEGEFKAQAHQILKPNELGPPGSNPLHNAREALATDSLFNVKPVDNMAIDPDAVKLTIRIRMARKARIQKLSQTDESGNSLATSADVFDPRPFKFLYTSDRIKGLDAEEYADDLNAFALAGQEFVVAKIKLADGAMDETTGVFDGGIHDVVGQKGHSHQDDASPYILHPGTQNKRLAPKAPIGRDGTWVKKMKSDFRNDDIIEATAKAIEDGIEMSIKSGGRKTYTDPDGVIYQIVELEINGQTFKFYKYGDETLDSLPGGNSHARGNWYPLVGFDRSGRMVKGGPKTRSRAKLDPLQLDRIPHKNEGAHAHAHQSTEHVPIGKEGYDDSELKRFFDSQGITDLQSAEALALSDQYGQNWCYGIPELQAISEALNKSDVSDIFQVADGTADIHIVAGFDKDGRLLRQGDQYRQVGVTNKETGEPVIDPKTNKQELKSVAPENDTVHRKLPNGEMNPNYCGGTEGGKSIYAMIAEQLQDTSGSGLPGKSIWDTMFEEGGDHADKAVRNQILAWRAIAQGGGKQTLEGKNLGKLDIDPETGLSEMTASGDKDAFSKLTDEQQDIDRVVAVAQKNEATGLYMVDDLSDGKDALDSPLPPGDGITVVADAPIVATATRSLDEQDKLKIKMLQQEIAELRKTPDKNEVEIGVKKALLEALENPKGVEINAVPVQSKAGLSEAEEEAATTAAKNKAENETSELVTEHTSEASAPALERGLKHHTKATMDKENDVDALISDRLRWAMEDLWTKEGWVRQFLRIRDPLMRNLSMVRNFFTFPMIAGTGMGILHGLNFPGSLRARGVLMSHLNQKNQHEELQSWWADEKDSTGNFAGRVNQCFLYYEKTHSGWGNVETTADTVFDAGSQGHVHLCQCRKIPGWGEDGPGFFSKDSPKNATGVLYTDGKNRDINPLTTKAGHPILASWNVIDQYLVTGFKNLPRPLQDALDNDFDPLQQHDHSLIGCYSEKRFREMTEKWTADEDAQGEYDNASSTASASPTLEKKERKSKVAVGSYGGYTPTYGATDDEPKPNIVGEGWGEEGQWAINRWASLCRPDAIGNMVDAVPLELNSNGVDGKGWDYGDPGADGEWGTPDDIMKDLRKDPKDGKMKYWTRGGFQGGHEVPSVPAPKGYVPSVTLDDFKKAQAKGKIVGLRTHTLTGIDPVTGQKQIKEYWTFQNPDVSAQGEAGLWDWVANGIGHIGTAIGMGESYIAFELYDANGNKEMYAEDGYTLPLSSYGTEDEGGQTAFWNPDHTELPAGFNMYGDPNATPSAHPPPPPVPLDQNNHIDHVAGDVETPNPTGTGS